jgi:hypothetical protein
MIQTSNAVPMRAVPVSDPQEPSLLDPLLRLAGETRNLHALIIADHGLDLMCGLIRRGCLAATMLRAGEAPDAGDYGLVLVPCTTSLASADDLIPLVRRSLAPRGRLVVGVPTGKAPTGKAAVSLARRLRLNGFTKLRSTHLPGLTLLRADLRSVS